MKDVVILGAGGHAHVVADVVKAQGNRVVAFLDDDSTLKDCSGPLADYVKYNCEFIIGIGSEYVKEELSGLNVRWHTAIHPSAIISDSAIIGEGTVVMPNAVINARSKVGNHCVINTGAIVEHDNVIGDLTHISVGAKTGGTVHIGRASWIGIGATVKNNINICDNTIVGAGGVVVKNIEEPGVYFGVPAKLMEKQQ